MELAFSSPEVGQQNAAKELLLPRAFSHFPGLTRPAEWRPFDTPGSACNNITVVLPQHSRIGCLDTSRAEVAELADAHGSAPCTRKGVGVRVPSSAPLLLESALSLVVITKSTTLTSLFVVASAMRARCELQQSGFSSVSTSTAPGG